MNYSKKGTNIFLAVTFFLLLTRLFWLQVIKGDYYRKLAEENRIRILKIVGSRGIIFDRHNEILADNLPLYKTGLGEKEEIVNRDEALKEQAGGKKNIFIDYQRNYPQGEIFGHVTGYVGQLSEEEMQSARCKVQNCGLNDWIGRTGIEEYYDEKLRGQDGGELVEVNTFGEILRRVGKNEPVAGKNLYLALDADLQRIAAREMLGKKGAVVVTNPQTGEVLVLYSSPSFNPNYFVGQRSEEKISQYLRDEKDRPLLNRVIAGLYPPGSTFKIVTSIAGLEEKKITKNTLINDPGVIFVGQYKYSNWYFTGYGRTEGSINLVRALKRSTDTFFYKLGEMIGVEKLAFWARKFNLGQLSGIDLNGEIAGLIPDEQWKKKVTGEGWFLGNTYHMAIGQGDLALTPLEVNLMTNVIANDGKLCRPRMLKLAPDDKDGPCQEIGIKKENLAVVKEGMVGVCSAGGTAYPFFDFKPQVACKTGTAEYVEDGKTKTHAWFTVFAPTDSVGKPVISITVLVENGGEGSAVAAPIAKEILKEFFLNK